MTRDWWWWLSAFAVGSALGFLAAALFGRPRKPDFPPAVVDALNKKTWAILREEFKKDAKLNDDALQAKDFPPDAVEPLWVTQDVNNGVAGPIKTWPAESNITHVSAYSRRKQQRKPKGTSK